MSDGMEAPQSQRPYLVIAERCGGEIAEKKSRFIAHLAPVEAETEALKFIEEMRKKYWDASHNCWAYIIGRQSELMRSGDDGEPQGTAGRPMLEVLQGEGLTYVAAVVTRYFGGTLLGTGGLVRTYTRAVREGLGAAVIRQMRYGSALTVTAEYPEAGKIQYWLGQKNIPVRRIQYEERVSLDIMVPFEDTDNTVRGITEAAMGRARAEITGRYYYRM